MRRGWQLPGGNSGNVVSGWRRVETTKDIFFILGCLVKWTWRAASGNGAEGISVRCAISRQERPGGGSQRQQQLCADGARATS